MFARSDLHLPSDRKFGIIFGVLFSLIAVLVIYNTGEIQVAARIFGALALVVFGFAAFRPRTLRPFNIAWMTLGMLLGKVVSPLVLGVIFFLLVTPLAVVLRLFQRDELSLKRPSSATTYWKWRDPQNDDPGGLNNQF